MRLFYSLLFCACARRTPADTVDYSIWSARYVVTMDPQRRVIENGAIAITGDHIVAAGPRAQIDKDYQAKQRVDQPDAILAPGLINTHTHAAMSLFRGVADDMKLQDWLEKFIFPAEARNVDREFVRWGTRLASIEMALSGTTTYTDMYYFEETVAEATKEVGLRGVLGRPSSASRLRITKLPPRRSQARKSFSRRTPTILSSCLRSRPTRLYGAGRCAQVLPSARE